ncbi:glycosyltransferase family 4 protein [Enterovibrio coralii]|uniref:Glycosyltransferase n=1 Tax=Enterovibrio coralii TaxID=294935 RepID=A0A135IDN7_9GAMM|nr:glycosyltransferase family 4 protein [Enterovibrio coralii]KXF83515.1 glycosyltransferase [Enterovibrio coralii]
MAKRSSKIWIVLDSSGFGGIESHVEQLALGLSQSDNSVSVVFIQNYGQHPLEKRLQLQGVDCLVLDGRMVSLWQAIKTYKPDIIHTHGYKAGILARPMARLMGISCASTFHSGEKKTGRLHWYDWLDRNTAFLANHVYAVSTPILDTLPCPATLTNNFVDTNQLQPSQGDKIAFVGRLSHEKAPERMLTLAKRFPLMQFDIFGDGPLRESLESEATENVTFHGAQDNMREVWPQIGLLVIPSRAEGLPMVALEAMARGIPVAAFNVGGLGTLIEHGKNGWLLEPNNMDALIESISTWRNSNERDRLDWRDSAIDTIETRFSAKAVVPLLLKDYAIFAK